ncbi:uncharacterized protein LOC141895456 [Acropora palmata]|uniref:uncharacterized protein LOC141895456 n=1 Tax=Acropora palmata TaxID=6131 RepID=UPI003DA16088
MTANENAATTMTPMATTTTSAMAVSMTTSVHTDVPISDTPTLVATSTTIAAEMSSSMKGKSTTTAMHPLTASSVVSPPTTSTPTAVSNFISLDGGKYNVSWMFHSSMDTFHFVVKVRATGWIGFGLATRAPNRMSGYDVAVSETNNGTKYLKDYFTGSFAVPPQDAKQDWMLSYFSEEQNVATLKFYRKRDTDDTANDIAIQPGQSYYFIWAYHFSDTVTPGRFPKHSFSGSYQVGPLIPSIQPTTTASTESPATPGTSLPTQMPFPYAFDDNKFLALEIR